MQVKITLYRLLIVLIACTAILNYISNNHVHAQTFPAGFTQVQVANNIQAATSVAVAPDGRVFIAQQNGRISILKNGNLLSTPFALISVGISGERGLIGIAIDPNFQANNYVYIHYTVPSQAYNKIARITATGDFMEAGSEVTLLTLDSLSSANMHNGGGMKFGLDGKLYICVGENTIQSNAQSFNSYKGKVLRINKDGSVPVGNPYQTGNAVKRRIWAMGLRNPFSLDIQPGTGRIFVNDVGSNYWEEINEATVSGKNFGWPNEEGIAGNPNYSDPLFTYQQGTGDSAGCAITAGCFFNPSATNYPAVYNGQYFYIDYCEGWIRSLDLSGPAPVSSLFASGLETQKVCLFTGTDGNLYYISRATKGLYKIIYSTVTAPQFVQHPQSQTVNAGQNVTFSAAAVGTAPIAFQWKKNMVNIAGATNPVLTLTNISASDSGNYKCQVTNDYGTALSNQAKLTVGSLNYSPDAVINSPLNFSSFNGGDLITFNGSATDTEDGNIPPTSFQWEVIFHHETHVHPGPFVASGVTTGSFIIPAYGETSDDIYYELRLIVFDSQGASDTASVHLLPNISNITLNSVPQGAVINIDGTDYITPSTIPSVIGIYRTVTLQTPQTLSNGIYQFTNWQDGGTSTNLYFPTPVNDATYTAYFNVLYRNADNPQQVTQGLFYRYFKGTWNSLPDFNALTPFITGTISTFSLAPKTKADNFGFVYNGFVQVPADGFYTFYLNSDDGSRLYIGSQLLIDNDGNHAAVELSGMVGLRAGLHAIRVDYFEGTGSQILTVSYSSNTIPKQPIPASALYRYSGANTIEPVSDAYVRAGQFSTSNYGISNSKVLEVKYTTANPDNHREAYLKFDISKFSNDFGSVTLNTWAKLKGGDLSGCLVDVLPVPNNNWSESTITYSNRPTASSTPLDTENVTVTSGAPYTYDVTSYVQSQLKNGNTTVSFELSGINVKNNYAEFASKEATANHPYLSLNYAAPKLADSDFEQTNAIAVYPNPSHDGSFTIYTAKVGACMVRIVDMNGKCIKELNVEAGVQSIQIEKIPDGLYVVQVIDASRIYSDKIIVLSE